MIYVRTCLFCGQTFETTSYKRQLCSKHCEIERRRQRDRERAVKERENDAEWIAKQNKINNKINKNTLELSRLSDEALPVGLSYGKYVAMTERGAKYEIKERVRG